MEAIKPCPFCGGEAFSYSIAPHTHKLAKFMPDHPGSGFVECRGCPAAMSGDSEEDAVAAWNRRAKPTNKPLTLDELRQMDGEPKYLISLNKIYDPRWMLQNPFTYLDPRDYGITWLAYRAKPESEEEQ